jgi:chaperonin GroES
MSSELANLQDHLFPVRDIIILEQVKITETSSGIIIPESAQEKQLALRVVAVGDKVTSVKPGDLVIPSEGMVSGFKLFGKILMAVSEYQILARIKEDTMAIDATFNVFENLSDI